MKGERGVREIGEWREESEGKPTPVPSPREGELCMI